MGTPRCPYCLGDLGAEGIRCGGCQARYHQECADELRVCGTIGCAVALSNRPEATPEPVSAPIRVATPRPSVGAVGPGCLYCRAPTGDEAVEACPECNRLYHDTCALAQGRCVSGGCNAILAPLSHDPSGPLSGRRCPTCTGSIDGTQPERRCGRCGTLYHPECFRNCRIPGCEPRAPVLVVAMFFVAAFFMVVWMLVKLVAALAR